MTELETKVNEALKDWHLNEEETQHLPNWVTFAEDNEAVVIFTKTYDSEVTIQTIHKDADKMRHDLTIAGFNVDGGIEYNADEDVEDKTMFEATIIVEES